MENAQRWSVTYTKHVKQKRKIYQDGFLVLQPSPHKVNLYDEWDKLLETRFVKKDDVIKSGETVTLDSYLVDIGELCGGLQPTSLFNCQEKDRKVSEKSGSLYSYNSQNRKPVFGKSKGRVINLSPSQKMIKDFKKSEMNKFGSSPNCMDTTNSSTREWQVLYTTHITQKAKKFHDGFLELVIHGSQGRQVKLYDANRMHLNSRFLKKDETVCSGESLAFEGHLVEIGEQEGDHKPQIDIIPRGKNFTVVGKTNLADQQVQIRTNKKLPPGRTPDATSQGKLTHLTDSSSKIQNTNLRRNAEPRRAVNDILSILRQPNERKVVPMNKPMADDCLESHSSDSQTNSNTKNHIQKYDEECSGTALTEKTSDHNSRIKVLKPEAVEVIASGECTVSENGRDSQSKRSYLRSIKTNCVAPTLNVECSDHNELISNSPSMESHILVKGALDGDDQTAIEYTTLTRPNETEEPEIPCEMPSLGEITTDTNAAATKGLSSSKLPKLIEDQNGNNGRCEKAASCVGVVASDDCVSDDLSGVIEKTHKQDFHTKAMDELPSFDLGF